MVSFNAIPSDLAVPLFYAEVDNSQAFSFQGSYRQLLIGQTKVTAPFAQGALVAITSVDQARTYFGRGSMLARMCEASFKNNDITELHCAVLVDDSAATAATGSLRVTAKATEAGTDTLYIAGRRVRYGLTAEDTAEQIADKILAAISAGQDLPVTAAKDSENSSKINLTAKNKGLVANALDLRRNFHGAAGGEVAPAELAIAIEAMSGGAGNPDITAALGSVGDEPYRYIGMPYSDTANLDAMQSFLDDITGRWSPLQQNYAHCVTARTGTLSALSTFGKTRNDRHTTCLGYHDSPTPPDEAAAIWTGIAAKHISIDPARPLQSIPMVGFVSPPEQSRFTIQERNILLHSGIGTSYQEGGTTRVERFVTMYQENAFGEPDSSYMDANTLFTLAYVLDFLRARITQKYPRHKLASDGTRFGRGQATVTPNIIRAELIAAYGELEERALVENMTFFKDNLIVQRDSNNHNRVNVLFPPDLVNQLRIFALLAQFRLQARSA